MHKPHSFTHRRRYAKNFAPSRRLPKIRASGPGGQSKGQAQIQSSPTAALPASIGERSDSVRSLSDRFLSEGRSAEKIFGLEACKSTFFAASLVAASWQFAL